MFASTFGINNLSCACLPAKLVSHQSDAMVGLVYYDWTVLSTQYRTVPCASVYTVTGVPDWESMHQARTEPSVSSRDLRTQSPVLLSSIQSLAMARD